MLYYYKRDQPIVYCGGSGSVPAAGCIKTVAENWVSKQGWFVLILKPVNSWLKSYLFRNKTFLFFKIES